MKTMATAMALAAAVWGCEAKAAAPNAAKVEGPVYTATVKINDV
jgi:hypothetical protein